MARSESKSGKAQRRTELPASPLPPPDDVQREAIAAARRRLTARVPRLVIELEISAEGKVANIGPEHSDQQGWLVRLQDTFASRGVAFPTWLLNQLIGTIRYSKGSYDKSAVNAMIAAVEGAKPENEVQAMLAVQMAITHDMAVTAMQRAIRADQIPQYDSAGSMAVKLMRTFTMQVEALAKAAAGWRTGRQGRACPSRRTSHRGQCCVAGAAAAQRGRTSRGGRGLA